MKTFLSIILFLVALSSESQLQFVPPWIGVGQKPASGIAWGTVTTISADTDVDTTGTLQYAYCWQGTTTTINGVTFTASASTSGSVGGGNVNLGTSGWNPYNGFSSGSSPYASLSAAYQAMLTAANYGVGPFTVTLGNLTIGINYRVQIWGNDARGVGTRTEIVSSTGGNSATIQFGNSSGGAVGQYVIGTFTATAITEALTFTQGNANGCQFNGIQLRSNP